MSFFMVRYRICRTKMEKATLIRGLSQRCFTAARSVIDYQNVMVMVMIVVMAVMDHEHRIRIGCRSDSRERGAGEKG